MSALKIITIGVVALLVAIMFYVGLAVLVNEIRSNSCKPVVTQPKKGVML